MLTIKLAPWILFILFGGYSTPTNCQTQNNQSTPPAASSATNLKAQTPPAKTTQDYILELEAARIQLNVATAQRDIVKEYHSSLLDTVYWALAATVTLMVLMAGFNWFSNFKIYEGDKERLKNEINTIIGSLKSSITERLAEHDKEIIKSVNERLTFESERTAREIIGLKSDLNEKNTSLIESDKILKKLIDNVNERSLLLDKKIILDEAQLGHIEEIVWEMKNVPANVLLTQAQGVEIGSKLEDKFYIKSVVIRMKRTLESFIESGEKINSDQAKLILDTLNDAKNADLIEVSEIINLVNKLPTTTTEA